MTTKAITILDDKRLFPTVMNVIEGSNKVDTVVYTMENYIVGETDLSKYDWYAHFIGIGGIDEVKLTSEIIDGKLVITFNLTEYVTTIGNTLTYQIVAKDTQSAVWYSAKGIILNSNSIQADDFVVANYPSILKQWENRLNEIIGGQENAYVIIPYNETIHVEDRIAGKFYLQRLNDVDYSCIIEDAEGHVITDGNVVHKTGDEVIEGLKRFTNNDNANRGVIELSNNKIGYSDTPESDEIIGSVRFTDKNGETIGVIETVKTQEDLTTILMNVRNGNKWGRFLSLTVDKDGFSTSYSSTPSFEANGDEIATTAWVNNKTQPATTSTYGLMRVAAEEDEIDCSCNDASITPSNLYDLADYRRVSTRYNVDDIVGCPYHANLILKCTTAGYTSGEALDTSGTLNVGDTITDGSVVWTVEEVSTTGSVVTLNGSQDIGGNKNFTGTLTFNGKDCASWSIPGDKDIDLTLGASGSTYIAPANGWFFISIVRSSPNGRVFINANSYGVKSVPEYGGSGCQALLPVGKGEVVTIGYDPYTSYIFKFIYAKGEK